MDDAPMRDRPSDPPRPLRATGLLDLPGVGLPLSPLSAEVRFGGFHVVERLAETRDVQVLFARGPDGAGAIVKWAESGARRQIREDIFREAQILQLLEVAGMPATPRVLDCDHEAGWIALSAPEGEGVGSWLERPSAGIELRAVVAERLVNLYDELHERGVVHGRAGLAGVRVNDGGRVSLVDFSAAYQGEAPARLPYDKLEPEAATAFLAGGEAPLTALGEQHAVAALAYRILTRRPWPEPARDPCEALRQTAEARPRPFADVGLYAPAVEAVLLRGMANSPAERWPSMSAFAQALARAIEKNRLRSR